MKRSTFLTWAFALFIIGLSTLVFVYWFLIQETPPTLAESLQSFGWNWALPVVFSLTAALILAKQPGNRVGWLLMITGVGTALSGPSDLVVAEPRTVLTPALWLVLWVSNWGWILMIFPIILIPLHFPDGRPPSPRWRWVNWLAAGMWIFLMLEIGLTESIGPFDESWLLPNPIGFIPNHAMDGLLIVVWGGGLLALTIGSVASLIVRYRRAGFVEKEQIKWLVYAASIFGLVYAGAVIANISTPEVWSLGVFGELLLIATMLLLPITITIAILRYHLFDIDVIIRKTAVYGVLSVILALVYFGSVILLQTLFGELLGEQSTLILVVSTLLIAALFSPLRRWVQNAIDRRFFRSKYDAQKVMNRFAQVARSETDLDNLSSELLTVLYETFQPQSVGLWTAPPRQDPDPSAK
jgi:hypothetical protein